jgi:hypothetical protein
MKKLILAAAMTLASLSPALASSHYVMTYHDNIRPNGHPRSDSIYNAALDACYSQTGLAREAKDTQAFKDCMATHDYRWVSTKLVQDPPSKRVTRQAASAIPKGHFIDPDNGLLCQHAGWASICESPPADMTIHYTNKHGLNCTRTGAMSICSNL